MNDIDFVKKLKDIMNALRDKRKLGKETDAEFLLEGQIAAFLKSTNQYP